MVSLLIVLSLIVSVRSSHASDLTDGYKPDYTSITNKGQQIKHIGSTGNTNANNKHLNMVYNNILHLLHNEKSNKVVLENIHKKGTEADAIAKGITTTKLRRNDDVLEDSRESYGDLRIMDENVLRSKRSAMSWLKSMLHGTKTTPQLRNKPVTPIVLHESHEIILNTTFTDILTKLTESIEALNRNLINLKVQESNEAFVVVKMPLKNYVDHVKDAENVTRLKREVNDTETSENSKPDNITTLNITNKDEHTENEEISIKSNVTVKAEDVVKVNGLDSNKSIEINTNLTLEPAATTSPINKSEELNTNHTIPVNLQPETINSSALRAYMLQRNPTDDIYAVDRDALLMALDESYSDIKQNIQPIQRIKDQYSQDAMYKIGYIIANFETMDLSLNKLMAKLTINKDVWETKRLRRVLQKMKLSNNLVENIMDRLHEYIGIEQKSFKK